MKTTLGAALLSLLLCAPAGAQGNTAIDGGDVEVGNVLVCDTQEQVEHYIMAYNGDQDAAIRAVNRDESRQHVCGVVSAAFVRGPQIAGISHGYMAFKVTRILVLGVEGENGLRAVDPALYFSAFGVAEYPV
jgi:hypothetical protein